MELNIDFCRPVWYIVNRSGIICDGIQSSGESETKLVIASCGVYFQLTLKIRGDEYFERVSRE